MPADLSAARGDAARSSEAALTNLLDHIAEQLAEEYVRLMEAAAEGAGADTIDTSPEGGGE